MFLSRIDAAIVALAPFAADAIEKKATSSGILGLKEVVQGIKQIRNLMYISVAIAAIATVGVIFAGTTPVGLVCGAFAIGGAACLTAFYAKRLYDITAFLRTHINIQTAIM